MTTKGDIESIKVYIEALFKMHHWAGEGEDLETQIRETKAVLWDHLDALVRYQMPRIEVHYPEGSRCWEVNDLTCLQERWHVDSVTQMLRSTWKYAEKHGIRIEIGPHDAPTTP